MANERRLRINNVKGILGASLAAGATTVNLGATLSAAATPDANSYLPVIVEPDTANEEIIWLTGGETVAGNHTYPCVKAREGSSDLSHGAVAWQHGPTETDFRASNRVDLLWGGDLGFDYEFEARGPSSTLPTGWSWVNQGTATYAEDWGLGTLLNPGVAGPAWDLKALVRAAPTGSTWTLTAKITAAMRAYDTSANRTNGFGLIVGDSAANEWVGLLRRVGMDNIAATSLFQLQDWTSPTTSPSAVSADQTGAPPHFLAAEYWRIVKNSATSYDFMWSADGVTWWKVYAAINLSTVLTTFDRIGFGGFSMSYGPQQVGCHWLRVR